MQRTLVEQRTILLGIAGSQSYQTNLPDSDFEYKGICVAPKEYYLGFSEFEQKDKGWNTEPGTLKELDNAPDSVIYELRKYLQLAAGANPNILELLWCELAKNMAEFVNQWHNPSTRL
ncbi:DNA polymerase beta superfamily protein [Leptolyngbya sp. AN03gr2]|uniref:DNA polymerase beta superfamily protein n=1 Tax=unclassified Leptolyngbya TaxID=2650499 RepID=UPI003D31AEFE